MRTLLVMLIVCLASTGLAQGVVERLYGNPAVVGRATNDRGAVFIELATIPLNIMRSLREGLEHEESQRVAIITPDSMVRYGLVLNGNVYTYQVSWLDFVVLNSPNFSMDNMHFEDEGRYLRADAIADAREGVRPRIGRPGGFVARPPNMSRNGCDSSTTASRSTMTCYSNGRVTYRSVCTTNPVTYAINCTSDTY